MKGVATCRRCGFQWVRGPDEARFAKMCSDCLTVPWRTKLQRLQQPPAQATVAESQSLVAYLGIRSAALEIAVRTAYGALRMGKPQEAIQILKKANRNDEAKQKKHSAMEDRILAADTKEAQARHGEHDA